jgi:hypothetical protein
MRTPSRFIVTITFAPCSLFRTWRPARVAQFLAGGGGHAGGGPPAGGGRPGPGRPQVATPYHATNRPPYYPYYPNHGRPYYGHAYYGGYPYYGYPYYGYPGWGFSLYYGYPWYGAYGFSAGVGYGYPGYAYGGYAAYPGYAVNPYGGVRIAVPQRNAEVYVDGYYAGIVNDFDGTFQQVNLEPGAHRIEVRAQGFEPSTFEVQVTPGHTVTYRAALRQAQP